MAGPGETTLQQITQVLENYRHGNIDQVRADITAFDLLIEPEAKHAFTSGQRNELYKLARRALGIGES